MSAIAKFFVPQGPSQWLTGGTAVCGAILIMIGRYKADLLAAVLPTSYSNYEPAFLMIAFITLDIYALQKAIETDIGGIKNLLSIVDLRLFQNPQEQAEYIRTRINKASKCVYDLTWYHKREMYRNHPLEKELVTRYERALREFSKTKEYREIFIFDVKNKEDKDERIQRLERRMREKSPLYSCKYFEASDIPRIKMIIIDLEEVILCSSHSEDEIRLAIKHPQLTKFFTLYFRDLWHAAKTIKEGTEPVKEELVAIRALKGPEATLPGN